MNKITLSFLFLFTAFTIKAQQIISHSTSQSVEEGAGVCADGSGSYENTFSRTYTLSNFGLSGGHELSGGQFGVSFIDQDGGSSTLNAIVSVYISDLPYPEGTLTLIAETEITISEADHLTLQSFNFDDPAVVNADDILAVEVTFPNGMSEMVVASIGENNAGETSPSYIYTEECGIPDPITFDENKLPGNAVINLVIDGKLNLNEIAPRQIAVYPNPSTNFLKIKVPASIEVLDSALLDLKGSDMGINLNGGTMNLIDLSAGVYILNMKTTDGTYIKRIVKN